MMSNQGPTPVQCPNEYGPPAGVHDGIFRFVFGECLCAKLNATPCQYDVTPR